MWWIIERIRKYKIIICVLKVGYVFEDVFKLSENDEIYENEKRYTYPIIKLDINDFYKYEIKNIHNKHEVIKKVVKRLKDKYLSNENQYKVINNFNTDTKIEIWKRGIQETFGNDKYYSNLSDQMKVYKIVSMENLAKLIKHGRKRAEDAANYHDKNSKVIFSYLESFVEIENVVYKINIDIRKSPNGENRFYIHSFQKNKEKESNLSQSQCGWLVDRLNSVK